MKYIKYLILFGIVMSSTVMQQNAVATQQNNKTIVTINNQLGSDNTIYLTPNIAESIQNTLYQYINDLYTLFKNASRNSYGYEFYQYNYNNEYYTFTENIYAYVKQIIDKKIINNVNEIEYIWQSVLTNNKKIVKTLMKHLEQYANDKNAPMRLQSISNKKVVRYPIDSLQSIIQYYITESLNKNSRNYTYIFKIKKIFNDMSTTENPRWGAFVNGFRNISKILREIDKNLLPDDAKKIKDEILIEFRLNKAKILANILELQKIPQLDYPFHTFEKEIIYRNDKKFHKHTTIAPYKLPIIMEPIQKHIETSETIDDLMNNITVYENALNQLLSIHDTIQSAETSYIIYYICNNGYNNPWVINYIEQYVESFIQTIKGDKLSSNKSAKLHKQLFAILHYMKDIQEWQPEYNKLVNLLNSNNKSTIQYGESLYKVNNQIIDQYDINNSDIFVYKEVGY